MRVSHSEKCGVTKIVVSSLTVLLLVAGVTFGQPPALTFFGWSDQHVQTNGDGGHLVPAILAMNGLVGRGYPAGVGGVVGKPAFVFGLGDITEWPTRAARDTYERLITKRLKFPSYDVAGNHDSGGNSPSRTVLDWLVARHGSLSYTFEKGGVLFVAVYSEYDESLNSPAQPITKAALDYIRKTLAKVPKDKPVVVATHLCFDAITNRDEFVDALGDANVIMVLGGHYHKANVRQYRGVHFVQLPSPTPNFPNEVTVVRITKDRLVAIPFNYDTGKWVTDKRKILDVPIKGPAVSPVREQPAVR